MKLRSNIHDPPMVYCNNFNDSLTFYLIHYKFKKRRQLFFVFSIIRTYQHANTLN